MDEQAVIDRITALLPDAQRQTVEGDTFFFWGDDRQIPFATLVTKDAHDAAPVSDLARDGVYRLNVGVGKETYTRMFGPPPPHPDGWRVVETGHDYSALDTLMPNPTYSPMSWVSVLNPSEATLAEVEPLLTEAYENAEPQAKARLAKKEANSDQDA